MSGVIVLKLCVCESVCLSVSLSAERTNIQRRPLLQTDGVTMVQHNVEQALCRGTGVTDITDITDITDVTDIGPLKIESRFWFRSRIQSRTDITDVQSRTDITDVAGRYGCNRHYGCCRSYGCYGYYGRYCPTYGLMLGISTDVHLFVYFQVPALALGAL